MNSKRSASDMILLLIILPTIHDVCAMKGDFYIEAEYSEYIVSIWYYHEHRCTGSILNKKHILTSGTCVADLPKSSLSVAAGITDSGHRNIQLIPVEKIHYHPNFHRICLVNDHYWENNIAILKLSEILKWDRTVAGVPLIDAEFNWSPCYKCQTLGWHDETIDNVKLLTLRRSPAIILEDERCSELNVTVWKNEKCLKNQLQNVLEEEDYGAPVFCGGLAVGILVHGGTKEGSPSVLLSIYPYLGFIASILLPIKINIPGRFPYYVALFHNGHYQCGGSIIDYIHIITAAHCVEHSTRSTLAVLLGRRVFSVDDLREDEFGLVDHILMHPDYKQTPFEKDLLVPENDIAVLKLRAPLTTRNNVEAIALPNFSPIGQLCRVHRWSRIITKEGKKYARSLSSPAIIKDYAECRHLNPFRQPTDFCVMNVYSLPIAARGDSGSPIVCHGAVVGVLSSHSLYARACAGPVQGIYYTSTAWHLDFIEDAVGGRIP